VVVRSRGLSRALQWLSRNLQAKSAEYEQKWATFLATNPTPAQICLTVVLNQRNARIEMYILNESRSDGLFRARPVAVLDYLAILRGEVTPKGEIPFSWIAGSDSPGDIVWTDALFPMLLSSQARLALKGITGWASHPVSLRDPDEHLLSDFHLLTVQGRCGKIDFARSTVVHQNYPGGVTREYRGIFFDEDSWDHSDIFMPENRIGYIFVSEKAKIAFEKLGSSGPHIEPLEQIQLDEMTRERIEQTSRR